MRNHGQYLTYYKIVLPFPKLIWHFFFWPIDYWQYMNNLCHCLTYNGSSLSSIDLPTGHWPLSMENHGPTIGFFLSEIDETISLNTPLLTLMLLVANLPKTKWCKLPEKWLKPWHMGTHLKVLSETFPMNTNMTGFRWFSKLFASLCVGRK